MKHLRNILAGAALMAALAAVPAYMEIPERPGHALETVLNASEDQIRLFDPGYGEAMDDYRSRRRIFGALAALSGLAAAGAIVVQCKLAGKEKTEPAGGPLA